MKRFLSIDWDFFIDATEEQRIALFPDGGNENHLDLYNYIWDTLYKDPLLYDIKVKSSEYKFLLKMCDKFRGSSKIADSHKYAYDFIMENTKPDEEFEVWNIDHHHDLYNYRNGDERVNCGNWGTVLLEDRPNAKFIWVKNKDSVTQTIGGVDVDAETLTFNQFFNREDISWDSFDYLYLCRSSIWSPPHLDQYFVEAVNILIDYANLALSNSVSWEDKIDKPRTYPLADELGREDEKQKIIKEYNALKGVCW